MKTELTYPLPAGRVALVLGAVASVLVALHLIAMQAFFNDALGVKETLGLEYWHVSVLDLDEEESFGTWFSSGVLLMAALLLLHQGRAARARALGWSRWWHVLGMGFCVLSLDEVVGLHEYVNTLMGETSWTVVGFVVLTVVGATYLPFLWHHRWRTGVLFLAAGVVYGGGAVGVEHFTGDDVNSLGYNMGTALEEGMEMGGAILFVFALLDHARRTLGRDLRIQVPLAGSEHP